MENPVLPFTRRVFVLGIALTAGTGIGLVLLPRRTADYWAWEIKAPLSASFFGAGYVGAATALALAAATHEWRRARPVAIAALCLTSLALLATALHREPFAFGDGGLPEVVAWIWLAVYVALPPLLFVAFVLQERVRDPRPAAVPALRASRIAIGAAGLLLAAAGVGLVAGSSSLASGWPWPLPALPAAVLGAWLCTFGAPLLWFALFEPDWDAVRIGVVPLAVTAALDLASALRFRGTFDPGGGGGAYAAIVVVLLLVVAVTAAVEEHRLRRARA